MYSVSRLFLDQGLYFLGGKWVDLGQPGGLGGNPRSLFGFENLLHDTFTDTIAGNEERFEKMFENSKFDYIVTN